MKKMMIFKRIIVSFLMIFSILSLVACSGKTGVCDVALVTDVGKLMDAGFNQGTWEGLKEIAVNKNKKYDYYQLSENASDIDEERIKTMREAVNDGAKIIIVPGYGQATALEQVAKENPNVKFVFVDGWSLGLPNVTAINYKEEESGYMVGYATVMDGYKKLGGTFGGGGSNPACNRFCYGYVQGAADAAKEKNEKIEIKYSYKYGENFQASNELEAQIDRWYREGVEVVFACGGSMFYSVKRAAEKTKKGKVIGVDVDQTSLSPRVITSAVKGLAVSVKKILTQYYLDEWDKKLAGRVVNLGAMDDATGLPYATSRFKKFTKAQYENAYNNIKNENIKVDRDVPENAGNANWLIEKYKNNNNVTIIFE